VITWIAIVITWIAIVITGSPSNSKPVGVGVSE
jgi:hypothetical protein